MQHSAGGLEFNAGWGDAVFYRVGESAGKCPKIRGEIIGIVNRL